MNKLKILIALCLFSYADLSAQEKDSIDHSIILNYRITSYFDKYPLKGNTVKLQGPSLAIAIINDYGFEIHSFKQKNEILS